MNLRSLVGPPHGDCRPEGSLRAQERSSAYGSAFLGQVPACRIGTVGDAAPSEPVAVLAPGDVVAADLAARPGGSGLLGSLSTDVSRLVGDGDNLRGVPLTFLGTHRGSHRKGCTGNVPALAAITLTVASIVLLALRPSLGYAWRRWAGSNTPI